MLLQKILFFYISTMSAVWRKRDRGAALSGCLGDEAGERQYLAALRRRVRGLFGDAAAQLKAGVRLFVERLLLSNNPNGDHA